MERIIKAMESKYLLSSLELVEDVFATHDGVEEGKMVRRLVEEIRSKKYYIPELLILTPVAVKTQLQRQHISKEILEYGFSIARKLTFKAILVEGNPANYNSRGFQPSYRYGIEAGENVNLPHPDCLMVKELEERALENIKGFVDYSFYESLR